MRHSFLAGSLLALAACAPKAETPDQIQVRINAESIEAKRVIDSLNADFDGHFNAGHGDQVAAQYTEDGELAVGGAPVARGRAAIAAAVNGLVGVKATIKTTAVSVVANGPLAVERGDYTMSITPPGTPGPVSESGAYLIHWHKVDGAWKRVADVASSPAPIPAPPAPAQ